MYSPNTIIYSRFKKVNINEVVFVEESLKYIEHDGQLLHVDQEHKVVDARLTRNTTKLVAEFIKKIEQHGNDKTVTTQVV